MLGPIVDALAGFRPTLNPEPFEALVVAITTQQISLRAAAAIRGNLVRAYGVQHDVAWEFPTRERVKELRPRHFTPLGFSRAKAEYVLELAHSRLDLDSARRARRRRGDRGDHVRSRSRPLDRRLVPRAAPGAAARVAGG